MATLNFPDNPSTGDKYTDTNSGFTYEWDGTVWKSSDPSTAANIRELDNISGSFNGSTTQFNLTVASAAVEPANVQQLIISVGGVMQNAGDDYTVSGSTITFTTAPSSGLTFFGTLLGTALSLNTVADGSVSPSSLTTTSNYIVGGINVAGVVTGGEFSGDGSGLTGVASTDNIITSYGATFLSNVRVAGIFTAANAYVTGILTAQTLNYNNVVDIYSTGIITATRGIQQTGNEGLHVSSGITTVGILTATSARVGLGVTINNTGIDAGIGAGIITAKTYYGDATNMTGAGSTFQVLTTSPYQGEQVAATNLATNITFNFNNGISAGNADKNITLRKDSVSGTVVQTFDVDSDVTYSFGQAILNPSADLELENTYFVVADEGAVHKIGTASSSPIINTYSFTTAPYYRRLWVTGKGNFGVHGRNDSDAQYSSPVQVGASSDWASTGNAIEKRLGYDTLFRKTDGTLWAWGRNDDGILGLNDRTARSSPTQVGTDTTWRNVVFGATHTLATKTDGTMWSWGVGGNWLGRSNNASQSSPCQIPGTNWTEEIAAGEESSFAIKTDGTMWSWGGYSYGQLAQNNETNYGSPKQIGTDTDWSKLPRGMGYGNACGAIKTTGTLWMWGMQYNNGCFGNNFGGALFASSPIQIGTDTTWKGISMAGADESIVSMWTKTDGTLWLAGRGDKGVLGQNSQSDRSSPVQVGTETTWDTSYPDGTYGLGGKAAFALKTDGTLWTWGVNDDGGLGQNNRTEYSSPRQMGTRTDWNGGIMGGHFNDRNVTFFVTKETS